MKMPTAGRSTEKISGGNSRCHTLGGATGPCGTCGRCGFGRCARGAASATGSDGETGAGVPQRL
jgi:hypothetical protein